jgi:TPR repeat protein
LVWLALGGENIETPRGCVRKRSSCGGRAEQGDAEAEAKLGTAYVRGLGVPQDYNEALKWYRRSAEQGSAHGEAGLGVAYYYGYGVKPDYAESMRSYRKAAEQGDAAGEAGLGYLYQHGIGVTQDYAEALRWYRKAANQGQKLAERELGELYYNGEGVPQDYDQAFSWSYKGAAQGDAAAEYAVGYMYRYGQGVPSDRAAANRWFAKAAAAGDVEAQRVLSPGFSTCNKLVLLIQLLGGLFLLSFAPVRLHHLPVSSVGWDRNRQATVAAGLLCVFYVGLKWYGYTHLQLRRLGVPLNAFTCFKWVVELITIAAIVYMVRMDRQKARG